MIGRGLLGKWGPNHAADPLVTRYIIYLLILQEKKTFFPGGDVVTVRGWIGAHFG